ncbi:acetyltransferas-like protein [Amniculicola lignicola CBS 123094]|uniref:Acetyltransferas-like protein n=1 Tax=Amniculicola lignicola CBS 123094 TaxID=1392246 RepID=A0A6A5WCV6_9PLEO|nr:acetyltransferas-like protein [Amniculicola lignicola CBS 123094]
MPKIYKHPASSPALQHALTFHLPNTITLKYRTNHPNITQDAHILASFPPDQDKTALSQCWVAAYCDRSMRPETELWIYASGEHPSHNRTTANTGFCSTCKNLILALMDYLSKLPIPLLHPENSFAMEMAKQHEIEHPETGPDVRYPSSPGTYMRHLLIPTIVTLGTVHHEIMNILFEAGLVREEFPGREAELNKFIFRVKDLPSTRDLPEGLRWGVMRRRDIPIVQAQTPIPRSTHTLLSLKSVGVFEETTDEVVAWTFLGLDGSLTTLHTEPQYRGKGIAKAVAAKIFREEAPGIAVDSQGTAWAHADVYGGNNQSESVCRSLGGTEGWKVFWVRIDFGKAGAQNGAQK